MAENTELKAHVIKLEQRIRWFEKQLFGSKSEKRIVDNPQQGLLLGIDQEQADTTTEESRQTISYQRGKAKKQRGDDCLTDSGLRFNDDVPVERIEVLPPELQGDKADRYEIIDTKVSFKLAQRPASFVVLRYELPVIKHRDSNAAQSTKMPEQVLESSIADVSLLTGLLVDKFLYHLPLYRQHQRMANQGITLSRATLTNLVKRTAELLRPIVEAQLVNVLRSRVLAMDETPIKAGRKAKGGGKPGKMKQGWFWPVYGDQDEVVFTYSATRGRQHIETVLKQSFTGTLLSDGYSAYARYVESTENVEHAQCWVHTRRKFVEAEEAQPKLAAIALDTIGALYKVEAEVNQQGLKDEKRRNYRLKHAKPHVDALMEWATEQLDSNPALLPSDGLTKALKYLLSREQALRVFLANPDVPMDTNHLERGLRCIPMGRKNWNFCWTEVGAEHVGIIQSLITTCKLQGVNVTTYLIDVLQRIAHHPNSKIEELTPRMWKTLFTDRPITSVVSRYQGEGRAH